MIRWVLKIEFSVLIPSPNLGSYSERPALSEKVGGQRVPGQACVSGAEMPTMWPKIAQLAAIAIAISTVSPDNGAGAHANGVTPYKGQKRQNREKRVSGSKPPISQRPRN